jgi:hypothetical protein
LYFSFGLLDFEITRNYSFGQWHPLSINIVEMLSHSVLVVIHRCPLLLPTAILLLQFVWLMCYCNLYLPCDVLMCDIALLVFIHICCLLQMLLLQFVLLVCYCNFVDTCPIVMCDIYMWHVVTVCSASVPEGCLIMCTQDLCCNRVWITKELVCFRLDWFHSVGISL